MAVLYIETSALIKRYRTEAGTSIVNAIFERTAVGHTLAVSHLVTVEVESVASRGLMARALTRNTYGVMLRAFAEDLERFVILPVTGALLPEAAEAARQHGLRALDAIHFATVLRLGRIAPQPLVFVASDRDLLRAARTAGLTPLDPEDPEALEMIRQLK